jgi:hypothetical protein
MSIPTNEPVYVMSLEEVIWGGTLIAITMVMHGFGILGILRVQNGFKLRIQRPTFAKGMALLVLASWMILLVHLLEVIVWAGFFYWRGAVGVTPPANPSLCYYFALNEYTTLGSNYNLILRWRLLEGMTSMAGLMTFAWSTGVLLTLAQDFQEQQMEILRKRRQPGGTAPATKKKTD